MGLDGPLVIAYDGSPLADYAIRTAGAAFPGGRAAIVLHVYESPPALPPPPPGIPIPATFESDPVEVEAHAQAIAEHGAALAREAGFAATARAEHGSGASGTWSEIVEVCRQENAAALVIGARGHSGLRAALLGSVSDGVVHHAPCPVLVVPKGA
jgi:nucleotide-binding universal stress UspA family protein